MNSVPTIEQLIRADRAATVAAAEWFEHLERLMEGLRLDAHACRDAGITTARLHQIIDEMEAARNER